MTYVSRAAVRERDGGICVDCPPGVPPWPDDAWQMDHVVPLVLGGPDDLGNVVTRCRPHHVEKTRHDGSRRHWRSARRPRGLRKISLWVGRRDLAEVRLAFPSTSRSEALRLLIDEGVREWKAQQRAEAKK